MAKRSSASPKMTKYRNGGARVKKSSGCVGSAIARARERRKGH